MTDEDKVEKWIKENCTKITRRVIKYMKSEEGKRELSAIVKLHA